MGNDSRFATSLREFMAQNKTTQKALADYLGVRPQTVSYYCTGDSLPNCDQLLKIADYFGITADYLMTGRRVENKPVRELLGLSERTIENIKLVKEGYFDDSPYMLMLLDRLLSDKDFYLTLEHAIEWKKREAGDDEQKQYHEWKASKYIEEYLLAFFNPAAL
ncbi:hypothetical protein FACS1894184_18590 [Clostridia bacterium]|nr:hypothetical protein FACS1894184_18590 [Clostridia bacterium]